MRWPSIATIRSPGCSCPATAESAVNESTSAGCSQDCQYRPARIGTRRSSNPAGSCDSGRLHVAAVHRRRSQCHAGIAQRDHLAVIHPQHAVAAEQPGRGGDAADPADGRRIILLADHEHRPQQQDAQPQAGDRAGGDNRDALPDGLVVEGLAALVRMDFDLAFVEEFHVAAQRNGGDGELGAVPVAA
ncbi:hypothetical protein G6F68_012162 [Rhizopus microsporus]|nr:hypothetical protein G6F68_012162 [Rhizopus microsporus]